MAGGDPYLGRKDQSSRVYSFNASVHPYWINSNFKSVLAHFNDEPIFLGADTDIEQQLTAKRTPGALCRKDVSAIRERDHIQRLLDERRPVIHKVSMDILFDVRFLAKIALGFGYQALGSTYGELKYTDRLRKLLWTRRAALDAAQQEVRMAPYFASLQDKSHKMFALPVGFVFVLLALREGLVLKIIFPSGHDVQVSITDPTLDPETTGLIVNFRNRVLVAVPQLRQTIGPIDLPEYVAWKVGSLKVRELDELMETVTERRLLPSLR